MTWEFNIGGAENLSLSIDMAAMGDFEAEDDSYVWTYQIDDGPVEPIFTSSVDEDGSQNYTMESGLAVTLEDPLLINGTVLSDEFQTLTAPIAGSGSTLRLTLTAATDGGSEAYAAQDIVIAGDVPPPVINEVLASHTGPDNTEYFELFGTPGTSLEGLSLIVVEGEPDGVGTIDERVDFGADDALGDNGFFLVGNSEGLLINYGVTPNLDIDLNFENGDETFALVETSSLSGGVGTQVTGNEVVLDSVALTEPAGDGTFFFDVPVVGPDGTFFPAGARRVTDGVDTDSTDDFVLADFGLSQDNTPIAGTDDSVIEDPTDLTIPEIQGSGLTSEFGGVLARTTGIVTALDSNGFYLQDAVGDGDDATSDGLFIFTGGEPTVALGDEAEVIGRVLEFGAVTTSP